MRALMAKVCGRVAEPPRPRATTSEIDARLKCKRVGISVGKRAGACGLREILGSAVTQPRLVNAVKLRPKPLASIRRTKLSARLVPTSKKTSLVITPVPQTRPLFCRAKP